MSYHPCRSETVKPISIYADSKYIRAAKGGRGKLNIGANYGPYLFFLKEVKLSENFIKFKQFNAHEY